MKKILITGSVMNTNSDSIGIYKKLVQICRENEFEVSSPLDTMQFNGNDEDRYIRAMELINSTDFIIAEMSLPSTGQGMELQQAIIKKIPILIVAKENSKISGLIKGSKGIVDILYYNDLEDIKENIIKSICAIQ